MRALNLLIKEWTSFLQEAPDIVVVSDVDCLRFGLEVFLLAFLFCRVMSCNVVKRAQVKASSEAYMIVRH